MAAFLQLPQFGRTIEPSDMPMITAVVKLLIDRPGP
jgi:hypothetical protein